MVCAVESELAVSERGVDECAVVRATGVVMDVGAEEAAPGAHARDGNLAPLLERSDHLRESTKEHTLLGGLKRIHGGEQGIGPHCSSLGRSSATGRQADGHGARVTAGLPSAHEPLRDERRERVADRRGAHAEPGGKVTHAQRCRVAAQEGEDLSLSRREA